MIAYHHLPASLALAGRTVPAWVTLATTSRESAEVLSATYRGADVTREAREQLDAVALLRAETERLGRAWYGLPRAVQS